MPFKEKIAWLSVITTVLVWGTYFAFVIRTVLVNHHIGPEYFLGFLVAAGLQALLVIVASIVTAALAPKDAAAGSDERDKAIARHSCAIAYPVLLVTIVAVAASMHLGVDKIGLVYEMMAAIVIAEIVHYGAQIVDYRRGWHG
jgi:hypothetical protein